MEEEDIIDDIKILCTGDLHLGRHPSGIPEELDDQIYSPAQIWIETAKKAVEEGVDAVVLTGDVLDRRNKYYEAFGDFEKGIKTLHSNGIPSYGVSGNHDFDVLPGLVDNLARYDFHLLGRGGEWGSAYLKSAGETVLKLLGWSYPERHVNRNPVNELETGAEGPAALGVLHTEVDSKNSNYAPVTSRDLKRADVDGWLLGHIHEPELLDNGETFSLYPGSLQPLKPSEKGIHGPWIIAVDEEGGVKTNQIPLSNLLYEKVTVEASAVKDPHSIPAKFYEKTDELLEKKHSSAVETLVVTLELTGRSPIYSKLQGELDRLKRDLVRKSGDVDIWINKIVNNTRPQLDLEKISEGRNPAGVLAELLINLERDDRSELPEDLLNEVLSALTDTYFSNAYSTLRTEGEEYKPGTETAKKLLRKQGWLILDRLVSEKGEVS